MRADRLISILLLLQVNRRVTARTLAEQLEVSERTIHRDMEALGASGVPVIADRGTGGGWSLSQGYRTDLTGLNTEEVQTLFFAKSSRLLNDLGLNKAADAALIKLLASLTSAARRDVTYTRERLHVDGAGWYQSAEAFPFLSVVQEAVWQEKKLDMIYQKADRKPESAGTLEVRRVDPLGLVAKGNIWYLVAAHDENLRSYRVSRIQQARLTDLPCLRPAGFDLAAYWTQSVAEFKSGVPSYRVTVIVSQDQLARIRRFKYIRIESEAQDIGNGRTTMTVLFEDEREARDYFIRAGTEAVVIAPQALRDRIRAVAADIVALYS